LIIILNLVLQNYLSLPNNNNNNMAITRDFPLSPTPEGALTDSIDVAKAKAGMYAKKDFARKDFMSKPKSAVGDSSNKYANIVFDATKNMSKKDLAAKGVKRTISSKGDTTLSYNSKGVNFKRDYTRKK
jgi:hypothetical protein